MQEENGITENNFCGEGTKDGLPPHPHALSEFTGQDKARAVLNFSIQAARARQEPLSHVLICGAPGLGKTTLALTIADEMGQNIRVTSGSAITCVSDLASVLTNLSAGDVLFIEEIDRLCRDAEDVLRPAMETFVLNLVIGRGQSARSVRIDIPHFTLIGTTDRVGMLRPQFRERFGIILHLDLYTPEQLAQIVERSAMLLGTECDHDGAMEIARRSRGIPRVANRLLHRVRDFAEVCGDGRITRENARKVLDMLGIDELGLDCTDITLLRTIAVRFVGGPVDLNTLAAVIGEDAGTIEELYEPFLTRLGFLIHTPKGLACTRAAYEHLGISMPAEDDE